jgi:hypothetical protein
MPELSGNLEDMLYTAAVRAGWLSHDADRQAAAEVPKVEILIGISQRDVTGG